MPKKADNTTIDSVTEEVSTTSSVIPRAEAALDKTNFPSKLLQQYLIMLAKDFSKLSSSIL